MVALYLSDGVAESWVRTSEAMEVLIGTVKGNYIMGILVGILPKH